MHPSIANGIASARTLYCSLATVLGLAHTGSFCRVQVKSLQRALADAQRDARDRQDADALRELEDADKVVRGLGPGGDLCVPETGACAYVEHKTPACCPPCLCWRLQKGKPF